MVADITINAGRRSESAALREVATECDGAHTHATLFSRRSTEDQLSGSILERASRGGISPSGRTGVTGNCSSVPRSSCGTWRVLSVLRVLVPTPKRKLPQPDFV
jgi:hypothetical protein